MQRAGRGRRAGQQTNPDRRAVLTCKEPAADAVTGSKPEHETKVADAAVVDEILRAFGLEHLVATCAVSRLLSLEGAMMPRSHRRAYSAIVPGSSKRGDAPSATPQQDTAIGKRKSLDELSPSPALRRDGRDGHGA
jgi:hypothetical protein